MMAKNKVTRVFIIHEATVFRKLLMKSPPAGSLFARVGLSLRVTQLRRAGETGGNSNGRLLSISTRDAERSWRWMGADAAWTIANTGDRPIVATLDLEMSAFHRARQMDVALDGHALQTLVVDPARRVYRIGPLSLASGGHELVFHPAESPTVAADLIDNGDRRPLSFALGAWTWTVRGEQP